LRRKRSIVMSSERVLERERQIGTERETERRRGEFGEVTILPGVVSFSAQLKDHINLSVASAEDVMEHDQNLPQS
jgi:hypoxanthine-guanine phosphoribosyltransferase